MGIERPTDQKNPQGESLRANLCDYSKPGQDGQTCRAWNQNAINALRGVQGKPAYWLHR